MRMCYVVSHVLQGNRCPMKIMTCFIKYRVTVGHVERMGHSVLSWDLMPTSTILGIDPLSHSMFQQRKRRLSVVS